MSGEFGESGLEIDELERRMNDAPLMGYDQIKQVPSSSGVYTAWVNGESCCFYVGKASNLYERIKSHFSGSRASDRFCLYVYDVYVHKERCNTNTEMTTTQVNKLTSDWIRGRVRFRWIELSDQESGAAEQALRLRWLPTLNPLRR